jgi:hypothetical protein
MIQEKSILELCFGYPLPERCFSIIITNASSCAGCPVCPVVLYSIESVCVSRGSGGLVVMRCVGVSRSGCWVPSTFFCEVFEGVWVSICPV